MNWLFSERLKICSLKKHEIRKRTMKKTQEKIKGKRVLIWGYGREGKSTENFIKNYCEPESVEIFEGKRGDVHEDNYDLIFVSPGIPLEKDEDARFTSQTEVFLEEFWGQTVGITGTKGKSTTSAMLCHVLNGAGKKALLMGNIGKPCFDYIAEMDEETTAVYELSCHQCDRLLVSPHTAVFLNLYEDHLDRYITRERYFEAKLGITRNQDEHDVLYAGEDIPPFETRARIERVKRSEAEVIPLRVRGRHNLFNAEVVTRIAEKEFGIERSRAHAILAEFTGLPHRLQFAGCYGGVDYYDDSISTIPEAAISAAGSVENAKTVLIGGMDRNIDYTILCDFIRSRQDLNFILSYASGKRILESVQGLPNVWYEPDLDCAVKKAREITPPETACIMSNAAASYGYFKDFEERGDYFQKIIKV